MSVKIRIKNNRLYLDIIQTCKKCVKFTQAETMGDTFQTQGIKAGICSEERSLISPDYARNWICDFILGKVQDIGQSLLFGEELIQ